MVGKLSQIDSLKDSLLPFLIVVDFNGVIISSGSAMNKVAGKQLEKLNIEDELDFIFPSSFQRLCTSNKSSLVKFSLKNKDFMLKGDFQLFEKEKVVVLINTPIFNSLYTLKDSNLNLSDFAENTNMAEYLFLVESNKRGLDEAFSLVENIKQKNKSLSIVNKFAIAIQEAQSINDVLWIVAKKAVAELGYNDCVIYMFDEKKEYLIQKASHGLKNTKERQVFAPIKIKNGAGIVGGVASSGVGEIIADTSSDDRYIVDDANRLSEITVPIAHNKEVIGIIDSEHPNKNFFSNKDLELLKTIASITATKIVQTQFYQEIVHHKENLELDVLNRTKELNEAFNDLESKSLEIKKQNERLAKMALFPQHNPNPVIELDFNFKLIYANDAAKNSFRLNSLFNENPVQVGKLKRLLKSTTKGKKTGKYHIKEGFHFENKKFDFNIYIDNEMKFIRLYLNDITENTKLQNDLREQNESIFDSLTYSNRIQQSILPDLSNLKQVFEDFFILYRPKDIVSGDFYWSQNHPSGKVLFALNDCTGHGVPGALMSIIGNNALNSIMSTVNLQDISDIVNQLNQYYYNLRINSSNDLRDTMDVMILCFDQQEMCLRFSGSKQRFYIIRDNELQVYSADSHTLGLVKENEFSSEIVSVKKGDLIYLFTDGYVDQFGGPRGKKFKYNRFRDLLLSIHHLDMHEQKEVLNTTIDKWMQGDDYSHEQIDDISVVGFKV